MILTCEQIFFSPRFEIWWCRGVVVITTAQLHATKSELRFCAGSNPVRGVSEIYDGENLWQWFRLEIMRKHLSSVNHTTKTILHHQGTISFRILQFRKRISEWKIEVFHHIVASFLKLFNLFCSFKILVTLNMRLKVIYKKYKTNFLLSNTKFDCFKQILATSCSYFYQGFCITYILHQREKNHFTPP